MSKAALKKCAQMVPGLLPLYHRLKPSTRPIYEDGGESFNQQLQQSLLLQYQNAKYEKLSDAGFRCYSQFEEDGMILYALSVIGMKTRKVVELCCGSGHECMAANLIINHRYNGYLFAGDDISIKNAKAFFGSKKDCMLTPPVINKAWITRDNINYLLRTAGAEGEVDLLSLDMDGNDYWIWEAIEAINPRLCVFETHNDIPSDLSLTVPYSDDFYCWSKGGAEKKFRSVSLLAMKALSERKGYHMIGAHRHGFNVFFLRNDLANEKLPPITVEEAHDNEWTRHQQSFWTQLRGFPWVDPEPLSGKRAVVRPAAEAV